MTSLNDILWGDQLGNPDDENLGDGTDPIMPQLKTNCLAMCCGVGNPCSLPYPCASGSMGCK